jgi:hypothetical protein
MCLERMVASRSNAGRRVVECGIPMQEAFPIVYIPEKYNHLGTHSHLLRKREAESIALIATYGEISQQGDNACLAIGNSPSGAAFISFVSQYKGRSMSYFEPG